METKNAEELGEMPDKFLTILSPKNKLKYVRKK